MVIIWLILFFMVISFIVHWFMDVFGGRQEARQRSAAWEAQAERDRAEWKRQADLLRENRR